MFNKKINIDTDTEKYCNILVRYWYWLSIFLHSVLISILQYISDTDTCYFFLVLAKTLIKWVPKFSKVHFWSLFLWHFDVFCHWNSIFKPTVTYNLCLKLKNEIARIRNSEFTKCRHPLYSQLKYSRRWHKVLCSKYSIAKLNLKKDWA